MAGAEMMLDPERVLSVSIGVLIIFFFALALSYREPKKKTRIPKSAYHQDLGRAGDNQRNYKPKRNANRIINWIVTDEKRAFHPGAVITQQKKVPDVSFWQGLIDWNMMRSKTDAIILRAGQNKWVDSMFRVNYAAAKFRGILRSVYFFYDDRVSPGDQLATLKEALGDDLPEMEIWVDWENTYGGAFKGLKNVVAFMQAIEKEYPACSVGMYTGYWWFVEHSNAILNFSQYNYLKDKPFWLASYTSAEAVRIPAPWTALDFWQFGTPAEDWGQSSAEIDMSYWNGTEEEFYNRYAGDTPPPAEETEEIMQGTVNAGITNLNIRDANGATTGKYLRTGDVVYGTVANGRIYFLHIYRADGTLEEQPGNSATQYMTLADVAEPTPPAPEYSATFDGTFTLTAPDGKKYATHIILDVPLDPQ